MEEIKDKVLAEYQKGNIVVAGIEGLQVMPNTNEMHRVFFN